MHVIFVYTYDKNIYTCGYIYIYKIIYVGSCNEATSDPGCYYAISRQPAGHDDVQICVSPSLKYAEKCASPAL